MKQDQTWEPVMEPVQDNRTFTHLLPLLQVRNFCVGGHVHTLGSLTD